MSELTLANEGTRDVTEAVTQTMERLRSWIPWCPHGCTVDPCQEQQTGGSLVRLSAAAHIGLGPINNAYISFRRADPVTIDRVLT